MYIIVINYVIVMRFTITSARTASSDPKLLLNSPSHCRTSSTSRQRRLGKEMRKEIVPGRQAGGGGGIGGSGVGMVRDIMQDRAVENGVTSAVGSMYEGGICLTLICTIKELLIFT